MAATGKRKVIGVQNRSNVRPCFQHAGDNGGIDIGRETVEQARRAGHGQTGYANSVFDADFLAAQRPFFSCRYRAVLNDGIERIVLGVRATQRYPGRSDNGPLLVRILLQLIVQIHVFADQLMQVFQLGFRELQVAFVTRFLEINYRWAADRHGEAPSGKNVIKVF